MLARFRNGCLTTIRRKDGVERWLFRWRERCTDGTWRERNKVIGTVEEYPEKSKKLHEAVTKLGFPCKALIRFGVPDGI